MSNAKRTYDMLEILFVSNSQRLMNVLTFIKRMNNIHILVVVRLGFRSGDYLGFGGG